MNKRLIIARLGLRIRRTPEIKRGNIIGVIPRNAVVSVTERDTVKKIVWGKVEYNGEVGWMSLNEKYSSSYEISERNEEAFEWDSWPTDFVRYPNSSRLAINQKFGANKETYQRFGLPGHEGVDFYAPHGARIYTVASGTVYRVGDERKPKREGGHNYGVRVYIDHGGYKTIYAHLDKRLVEIGEAVVAGQLIGISDNTGNSSGSHLHLTMKEDGSTRAGKTNYPYDIVDPTPYMLDFLKRNK